jgi:O-antigen/teichoic acid export membrane protein
VTEGTAGRRLGLVTIDQVISGASNVLIAVLAARLLSAADFGLFGIVFLGYTILVGVVRALVSDPLLLHPEESHLRSGEAVGTTFLLAGPLTIGLFAIAFVVRIWSDALSDALIVLAICLPLLLLQDLGRYLGFATHKPIQAVVLDSVWLVLMLVAIGVLFTISDERSLALLIGAWGGTGALAGLLMFTRYKLREAKLSLSWLRYTWPFSWRFLVSYTAMQGSALGMSAEVGAIAGPRSLGGVQAALLLARPFTTFQVAAATAGIAEVARCADDRRRVWRHVWLTAGAAGGVAALNAVVMLVLPDGVGEALLGDSWDPAQSLLLPTGIYIVFIGLLTGPVAALLGLRAIGKATAIQVVSGILAMIAAAVGAVINGATGAMWFVAGSQGLMMVASWIVFLIHTRRPELTVPPDPSRTVPDGAAQTNATVN